MTWTRRGSDLWVETGDLWTGRTCTVDPDDPQNRHRPPEGEPEDSAPVSVREPGPPCPAGWYTPPCPWELRWPVTVAHCPLEVLAPWWNLLGPWAYPGDMLGPALELRHATFSTRSRGPDPVGDFERDPLSGTHRAARVHACSNGIVVEAVHMLVERPVAGAGSLLGWTLPTIAALKDMTSEATKRTHRTDVRAFLPLYAIASVEAAASFSNVRPLVRKGREKFDAYGRGPLDRAHVDLYLHDGWRTHHVSLRIDGAGVRYPYDSGPLDAWLDGLQHAIGQRRGVRSTGGWTSPTRWKRTIETDGAVPLCIPDQAVPA